jgi:hypothetical protein
MLRRLPLTLALVATTALITGCTTDPDTPTRSGTPSTAPDVVNLHGLRGIEFGDSERELLQRGVLRKLDFPTCGREFTDLATASPVFHQDKLVLLWIDPPVRTPEGITLGTAVDRVRESYPDATQLTAPPNTYRFDGLLAGEGDRAYLFLHDGATVQKIIVGYADYARKLFDEGFGTC